MHSSARRLAVVLIACVATANLLSTSDSRADACDEAPTGVVTSDYSLDFTVPVGLMPDPPMTASRPSTTCTESSRCTPPASAPTCSTGRPC